jgi:hypothetical protein
VRGIPNGSVDGTLTEMARGTNLWDWTRRVPSWAIDWSIAGSLPLIGVLLLSHPRDAPPPTLAKLAPGVLVALVPIVALTWRRTHPVVVVAVIALAASTRTVLGVDSGPVGGLAFLVAVYRVGAYASGRWRLLAGPVVALELRDRIQAVIYAYEMGLVQPGSV